MRAGVTFQVHKMAEIGEGGEKSRQDDSHPSSPDSILFDPIVTPAHPPAADTRRDGSVSHSRRRDVLPAVRPPRYPSSKASASDMHGVRPRAASSRSPVHRRNSGAPSMEENNTILRRLSFEDVRDAARESPDRRPAPTAAPRGMRPPSATPDVAADPALPPPRLPRATLVPPKPRRSRDLAADVYGDQSHPPIMHEAPVMRRPMKPRAPRRSRDFISEDD